MINWDLIVKSFNEEYDTEFSAICGLLSTLYIDTKSTEYMCGFLNISITALIRKMKECNIVLAKRGGANYIGTYKPLILNTPAEELENMAASDIAAMIGCTVKHVRDICNKNDIRYKRRK